MAEENPTVQPTKETTNGQGQSKEEKDEKSLLTERRNKLIAEIRPNLISNDRLRMGGSDVRQKHSQEVASFTPVIEEINEIGEKIGVPPIGLGHLRK